MSHVVVIGTDLRRATVKVSPGTYLTDVLQEACKKLNLPSDKYLLKHKQKQVDLSVVWRVSGLTPGAKLELVQKSNTPSVVSVALQLPALEANAAPNGRLIEKLPSDFTIWKVLRQFESGVVSQGKNLNLTARGVAQTTSGGASGSGQMYYETPVLNIMGRELATFDDFQKTLSQLGYNSGSVLIRLSFRKTDQTLFEAMGQISQFFSEVEAEAKKADQTPPALQETVKPGAVETTTQPAAPEDEVKLSVADAPDNQQSSETSEQDPADLTEPTAETMDVDQPDAADPLQPVSVFRAPSGTTPAAALADVPEDDYAPTIAHAQLHQARLQQSAQNKRLLSDKELEALRQAEEARLAAVSKVPMKVRFPDNTSAQWTFGHEATGATLYQAVRSVMAHNTQAFRLVIPGSKVIIKDEDSPKNRLIHDYKLTRSVLLSLVWNDSVPADIRKKPFLKGSVAQKATDVTVPDIPKGDDKEEQQPTASSSKPEKREGSGDGSVAKKLPKWLKLPGKK
ncbi:tethering factor for nuclear proteasome STS1 [Colletotrichum spaethianum]|uniref:Tethering factor for nuclear proteasome STS1 n=1 Tax=Colletotrichum spaethianum TaxID=700344 RepID=A0AA37NUB8_9PEZI|nr:tethering factor for nuclear proteasome STS1 [Colletotrichum spaethianum]GKT41872.1 tethering factor for nuclear proteasome STS1 [Colletotrichum spaethianum]